MKPKTMRRVYLREAAICLILARLAVRTIPSAAIFVWADRPPRRIRRFAVDEVEWVLWAVDHLAAQRSINALCLPRALAVHAMLRRRGIASRLCLGVAREGDTLAAHAWVAVCEDGVNVAAEDCRFTCLAAFGRSR
ncbi:MAG: lasso peptide biosynthesis B2 protein [Pseudomonadota bacterium]